MRVSGACHCGAIAVEAEVDEASAAICHCADCQVFSGSAFRGVVFAARDTFVLRGQPKTYVKLADSGRRRAQVFCPECGTALYACDADRTDEPISLRTGFLCERDQLSPRAQIWLCSAQPWTQALSAVPSFEGQDLLDSLKRGP